MDIWFGSLVNADTKFEFLLDFEGLCNVYLSNPSTMSKMQNKVNF